MIRPDKAYLEKQTSRRPAKKKKVVESSSDSRFEKITFKSYLRQIEEEELLDAFDEGDDSDLDEGYYGTEYEFPFIKIVNDENDWCIVVEEEDYQPTYWWNGQTNTWATNPSDATTYSSKQDAIADYGVACDAYREQFP